MEIGTTHGWIPDNQLYNDVLASMRPDLVNTSSGQLIRSTSCLLLRFVTDVGLDPVLSAYTFGTHERHCHRSLKNFFADNVDFIPRITFHETDLQKFYTNVNLLAHWVNLGYLNVEDVQNSILQSEPIQLLYPL
jgi:hypothetical protein